MKCFCEWEPQLYNSLGGGGGEWPDKVAQISLFAEVGS
jgi:hypothetical protein